MVFGLHTKKEPQAVILRKGRGRNPNNNRHGFFNPISFSPITLILIIICFSVAAYAWYSYTKYIKISSDEKIQARAEVQSVVQKVSRLFEVPLNEDPRVARISDPDLLSKNLFFEGASVDDRMLVYCKAKKSILYSPTRDRLVSVFPEALPGVCP